MKESLVEAVRRAQKNADAMTRIVTLNYQGITSLVYPNDNFGAMKAIKIGLIQRDIVALGGTF